MLFYTSVMDNSFRYGSDAELEYILAEQFLEGRSVPDRIRERIGYELRLSMQFTLGNCGRWSSVSYINRINYEEQVRNSH